ncbi:Retrotransposable element Tf2 [Senna tora]|uniref:Retrotransposable element Tf2 n=1 Tax=Senna tora TaxID=362788 RepID=A0A834WNK6_9FABA|nr:Retrotransposable element Tf2 [Senna tora]
MVGTRMEGRVENLEKEVGAVKVDVTEMKAWMLEMKDSLSNLEKKLGKGEEQDQSEGSGAHEDGEGNGNKLKPSEEVNDCDSGKYRKLELPIFNGEEAIGWLFRWIETRVEIQTWQHFKVELLRRFHQAQKGNNYEMLMALKQTGTVAEYREQFELISAPLKEAPEAMLIGAFQNGLKEEIRAELRMVKAQNLLEVMDLAHQVEEKNLVLAKVKEDQDKASKAFKFFQSSSTKWTPTRPTIPKASNPSDSSSKTSVSASAIRNPETKGGESTRTASSSASSGKGKFQKLTDEEIARKRRLRECFTCDEKWNPSHKCKNKHLHVILLSGQLEEVGIDELAIEDVEQKEEEEASGTLMSLSLNSIVGITSGRTMKLVGKVRGEEVLIMIDCWASHNFISTSLVDKMALPKVKTSSYKVTVGDGHSVQSEGKCKKLRVDVQGTVVEQDFYLFELGEVDLILGMEWLESLGEVNVNWKQLTMKFKTGEETVCLKGDSSLNRTEASYKAVMRSIKKGGQGYMLELGMVEAQVEGERKVPEEIQPILTEFSEVCEPLKGLPPHRRRDHAILIKEGTQPPNIRPYRYAHSQKTEIEKLVKEMLTAGIIRPMYERELVLAVKKWRHYLIGHKFVIRTDQKALKYLLEQRIIDPDQQKWASKLMGYSFEIQYKPGVENKAVDALSRREEKIELNAFSVWKFDELDSWEEEVRKDKRLSEIKEQIITGTKPPVGYDIRNGCLVYNGRLVLPKGFWVGGTSALSAPALVVAAAGSYRWRGSPVEKVAVSRVFPHALPSPVSLFYFDGRVQLCRRLCSTSPTAHSVPVGPPETDGQLRSSTQVCSARVFLQRLSTVLCWVS